MQIHNCDGKQLQGIVYRGKLIDPLVAGSVPIYAGVRRIAEFFNLKVIVNLTEFENYDEAIEYIRQVDNDDALYQTYFGLPLRGHCHPRLPERCALPRILRRDTRPAMIDYTQIPGWFSEEAFYDRMVAEAHDGATFVEIGCWLGKSTCYLAQSIKSSGKRIRLVAVDTWKGSKGVPYLESTVAENGGSVFELFRQNLENANVLDHVLCLIANSVVAADRFGPGECDFVFIDADHSYQAVREDITAWASKVKPGGMLAGHDICTFESVQRAVMKCLPQYECTGNVWFKRM